jgi:hypothetical protein
VILTKRLFDTEALLLLDEGLLLIGSGALRALRSFEIAERFQV